MWMLLAFVLFAAAAVIAGVRRSPELCLLAAGAACTVAPAVLQHVG